MENELIKIEIGCGKTKSAGYIGVDRFPLAGVDIVADVNKGLPFEDNYADVIYACHSLEHMDNLIYIFEEIYRICKHKGIVMILAPYYFSTLNVTNPYHKLCFDEDTPRFFSEINVNDNIPFKQYDCPHAGIWGLATSDNSEYVSEIQTLHMEYFYFEEYRRFTEEEKTHARRALMNVCDQIYYVLAVNKTGIPFTEDETNEILQRADHLRPKVVDELRTRDSYYRKTDSLLTVISNPILEKQTLFAQQVNRKTDGKLKEIREEFATQNSGILWRLAEHAERFNSMENILRDDFRQEIIDLKNGFAEQIAFFEHKRITEQNSLAAVILDILKSHEKYGLFSRRFGLFRKAGDMFPALRALYLSFTDGLILKCPVFGKTSILTLSRTIPFNSYFEYLIEGYGDKINFFVIATLGSELFTEVVAGGQIVKQETIRIEHEGPLQIPVDEVKGKAYIRFKTFDNRSIIRVLEVASRKRYLFERRSIAGYIE